MKLPSKRSFFLFVLIFFKASIYIEANEKIFDSIKLIIAVREFYRSSSVIIAYDEHALDFSFRIKLSKGIRLFSREGITSQAVRYDDLVKCTEFGAKPPLIVLHVKTEENLKHFYRIRKEVSMSTTPWLLFVHELATNCDDFRNPKGNPFDLRIDALVLVKCGRSNAIEQYYSARRNLTNVVDFGTWTADGKLELNQPEESLKIRKNLSGAILKVAKKNRSIGNEEDNFQDKLIEELANVSNFTTETVALENEIGFCNETNGRFDCFGLMKTMNEKKADLAILLIAFSEQRTHIIDFPIALMKSHFHLFMQFSNTTNIQWSAYFKAFNKWAWITLGVSVLILSGGLMLVKHQFGRPTVSCSAFSESFIRVWGVYSQQGLPETPSTLSMKILFFTILMSSMFIYSIYSAAFTSYIAVLTINLPFESYDDFLGRGKDYRVSILRGNRVYQWIISNDSKQSTLQPMLLEYDKLPVDPYDGFEQACADKIAFYADSVTYDSVDQELSCQLGSVKTGDTEYLTIPLEKESPYKHIFNYYFLRLLEHGLLNRLKNKYFRKYQDLHESQPNVITLLEAVPILSILIIGVIASLLILCLEMTNHRFARAYHRRRKRFGRSKPRKARRRENIFLRYSGRF